MVVVEVMMFTALEVLGVYRLEVAVLCLFVISAGLLTITGC